MLSTACHIPVSSHANYASQFSHDPTRAVDAHPFIVFLQTTHILNSSAVTLAAFSSQISQMHHSNVCKLLKFEWQLPKEMLLPCLLARRRQGGRAWGW